MGTETDSLQNHCQHKIPLRLRQHLERQRHLLARRCRNKTILRPNHPPQQHPHQEPGRHHNPESTGKRPGLHIHLHPQGEIHRNTGRDTGPERRRQSPPDNIQPAPERQRMEMGRLHPQKQNNQRKHTLRKRIQNRRDQNPERLPLRLHRQQHPRTQHRSTHGHTQNLQNRLRPQGWVFDTIRFRTVKPDPEDRAGTCKLYICGV